MTDYEKEKIRQLVQAMSLEEQLIVAEALNPTIVIAVGIQKKIKECELNEA